MKNFQWHLFLIELNKHEQEYDDLIKNYSSSLPNLRLERIQSILCLLKKRDDNNNINVVFGNERKGCTENKKS